MGIDNFQIFPVLVVLWLDFQLKNDNFGFGFQKIYLSGIVEAN